MLLYGKWLKAGDRCIARQIIRLRKEMYSTHFFLKSCNTSHMLYHYFI